MLLRARKNDSGCIENDFLTIFLSSGATDRTEDSDDDK